MKRIDKPGKTVADIIEILKGDQSNDASKLDMDSVVDTLTEREILFEEKVQEVTLYEIVRRQFLSARVSREKMMSYYTTRIVTKPAGREFYDEVFLSAPNDKCPYCTINIVKTIDHFLPKADYPCYAITPVNLVPSCRDCNLDKRVPYPTTSNDQTFHPYYDEVDNQAWMRAELQQTEPLSFQYSVVKPEEWSEVQFDRAKSHFAAYNINQLFSNEAARELRAMQHLFRDLFFKDPNELSAHLVASAASCLNGVGMIDWKTLVYQELSTNEWFVNGCIGNNFFAQ